MYMESTSKNGDLSINTMKNCPSAEIQPENSRNANESVVTRSQAVGSHTSKKSASIDKKRLLLEKQKQNLKFDAISRNWKKKCKF